MHTDLVAFNFKSNRSSSDSHNNSIVWSSRTEGAINSRSSAYKINQSINQSVLIVHFAIE